MLKINKSQLQYLISTDSTIKLSINRFKEWERKEFKQSMLLIDITKYVKFTVFIKWQIHLSYYNETVTNHLSIYNRLVSCFLTLGIQTRPFFSRWTLSRIQLHINLFVLAGLLTSACQQIGFIIWFKEAEALFYFRTVGYW